MQALKWLMHEFHSISPVVLWVAKRAAPFFTIRFTLMMGNPHMHMKDHVDSCWASLGAHVESIRLSIFCCFKKKTLQFQTLTPSPRTRFKGVKLFWPRFMTSLCCPKPNLMIERSFFHLLQKQKQIPSLKLTQPLKVAVSNRNLLFQGCIFKGLS